MASRTHFSFIISLLLELCYLNFHFVYLLFLLIQFSEDCNQFSKLCILFQFHFPVEHELLYVCKYMHFLLWFYKWFAGADVFIGLMSHLNSCKANPLLFMLCNIRYNIQHSAQINDCCYCCSSLFFRGHNTINCNKTNSRLNWKTCWVFTCHFLAVVIR